MLASINPLGERARGNRWGWTVAAFTAGALAVAAAIGAVLGGLGSLAHASAAVRLTGLGAAAVSAALVDLGRPGAVPTSHRQVDERWLGVYRGWVYGVGFGAQLGAGVVTVITSAMVYAWLVAAALAGSALAGAAVGAAFAVGRAAPFALVRRVRQPEDLRARLRLVMGWARPGRVIAAGASLAVGAGCLAARW
jgi:cytochrome c biogenesis protein CcdA